MLYYTNFSQRLTSGDTTDSVACGTILCEDRTAVTPLTTPTGGSVPSSIAGPNLYSALSLEGIDSNAYGASAQVSHESSIFGHSNHLVAGASFDGAISSFNSATYFGGLTSNLWFIGPGYEIDQGDLSTAPVGLQTYDQYYGVFFTDRYELTDRLAATVSGRFNLADIALHDRLGTALSGNNQYAHFNPGIGLTYQLLPPLQLFGNFSEANRAPTPNELECPIPPSPPAAERLYLRPLAEAGGRAHRRTWCARAAARRIRRPLHLGRRLLPHAEHGRHHLRLGDQFDPGRIFPECRRHVAARF